jgi:hypothetical protein
MTSTHAALRTTSVSRSQHYFGRFTHAADRCKSIFGNAGIAVAMGEG